MEDSSWEHWWTGKASKKVRLHEKKKFNSVAKMDSLLAIQRTTGNELLKADLKSVTRSHHKKQNHQ